MKSLTVIFDLETTGFCPLPLVSKHHKILQICARSIETEQTFTAFVNPGFADVPVQSTAIHHIKLSDVSDADDFSVVLKKMCDFFKFEHYEKVELIAHNSTCFDEILLRKECRGQLPSNIVFWDTLTFARLKYTYLKSFSLSNLYEYFFKRSFPNAHRADADVAALTELYVKVIAPFRHEEPFLRRHDVIVSEVLTSIRFIGEYRAALVIIHSGAETVSQLRKYFDAQLPIDKQCIDKFLFAKIGMKNVTQRLFVISALTGVGMHDPTLVEYLVPATVDSDCLDVVDYYVKYRYVKNEKPPARAAYERGLISVKNKDN